MFFIFAIIIFFSLGFVNTLSCNRPLIDPFLETNQPIKLTKNVIVTSATGFEYLKIAIDLAEMVFSSTYRIDFIIIYDGKVDQDSLERIKNWPVKIIPLAWVFPLFIDVPIAVCKDEQYHERIKYARAYYYKLAIFSVYFKKWDRVLYMDAKTNVLHPSKLHLFFTHLNSTKKIIGNPDGYMSTEKPCQWTLKNQFVSDCNKKVFEDLNLNYNLSRTDYFQSGVLFFDSSILKRNTLRILVRLYHRYGNIALGDQAILNLHFLIDKNMVMPFPLTFVGTNYCPYDYSKRQTDLEYILLAHRI